MRRPIIAGNWKLNCNQAGARALAQGLVDAIGNETDVESAVCPTFTSIGAVQETIAGSNIQLGAQNCYFEEGGAFTGEISPGMLKEAGCVYCIIGHSERRQYFGETDEGINKKAQALYAQGLKPIICVGENLGQRESGQTLDVVLGQLRGCLKDLPKDKMLETVIAYEPVWAIGTGKVATPEQAQEVHAAIRGELTALFDEEVSGAVRIQYGGSVKADNVKILMSQQDIDGALVGGASLKVDDFKAIVKFNS